MKQILYSYDVFDTCLIRTCGFPEFVFEIMAKTILGSNAETAKIRDFVLIRKNAEVLARNNRITAEKEDITIDDIYDFCDFSEITCCCIERIKDCELTTEKQVLKSVYEIKDEIDELHKRGEKIYFISDMYLSSSFIRTVLEEEGFYKVGDCVIVSCEEGKTKSSGHLYDSVQEKTGVSFRNWIHKGNNLQSDYKIPKKKGIKAELVKTGFNYYESELMKMEYSYSSSDIYKSACISRGIRLRNPLTSNLLFASTFIAPLYTAYVLKVLQDATKRGLNRLCFLARDGYILYLIAKEFSMLFPHIDLKYIYVSRKSLYLPGLKDVSLDSLKELIPNLAKKTLSELLEILSVPETWEREIDEKKDIYTNLELLYKNDFFVKEVTKRYNEQKSLCIRYFQEQGLSNGKCGIVDVAGTRKCQLSINRILKDNGNEEVFGYYLDVMPQRVFQGDYFAIDYQECYFGNQFNLYHGPQAILEQVFSITDQERTIGYKEEFGEIKPIYENELNDSEKKKYQVILNTNINSCIQYVKVFKSLPILSVDIVYNTTMALLSEFCFAPRKEYLHLFEGVSVSNSKIDKIFLIEKRGLSKLIRRGRMWLYGDIIYSSGMFYPIAYKLLAWSRKNRQRKYISTFFSR